jgi:signal transduction histidine kinase
VAEFQESAAQRGQHISLELGDGPLVTGDEIQIRQIVDNVLGNALKFGDPVTSIDVVCEHGPAGWTITITDVGPVIDPADAERIFEPFVRVGTTEGTTPGSGLGLPLARGLVELHGGSLTWDPTFTSGARFRIVLPTP